MVLEHIAIACRVRFRNCAVQKDNCKKQFCAVYTFSLSINIHCINRIRIVLILQWARSTQQSRDLLSHLRQLKFSGISRNPMRMTSERPYRITLMKSSKIRSGSPRAATCRIQATRRTLASPVSFSALIYARSCQSDFLRLFLGAIFGLYQIITCQ